MAITSTNLGTVYFELEDLDKAKELLERALKIKEEHFEAAVTLTNLGDVCRNLGDNDKAKGIIERVVLGTYQQMAEMLERVLLVFEDHYGAHHGRCNDVRQVLNWATRQK